MIKYKRKRKFNPETIWKEIYDIDLDYEKQIYFYLCGTIKRKNLKKLKDEHKFETYKSWKKYVKLKYNQLNNLDEFSRFLKLKSRGANNKKDIYSTLHLPIVIFFIGEIVIQFIESYDTMPVINIQNLIASYLSTKILQEIVMFALFMLPMLINVSLLCYLIFTTINYYWKANDDYHFIDDYSEIIKEIIDEKML